MGLFDFFGPENGPCSSCIHRGMVDGRTKYCMIFGEKKYDRVNGYTQEYGLCSDARSSTGFCGHKGRYWEEAKESTEYVCPPIGDTGGYSG